MATNDSDIICGEELTKELEKIDLNYVCSLIKEDDLAEINLPDTPSPSFNVPELQELNYINASLPFDQIVNVNIIPEDDVDDESSSTNSSGTQLDIQCYPCDIKNWDNTHIMKWILDLYDAENYRYEDLNIHYFRDKTGSCLADLEESFWKKIDNGRGSWLYKQAQCLIHRLKCNNISDEYANQTNDGPSQLQVPRKRGRPPKSNSKPRNKEKVGRIWEFLRDLLKDPEYCPRYIRWDNYENLEFCLVEPKIICEIWGQKKGKVISYEHFSRSIRHYYKLDKDDPESNKAKILSVRDRRLVYKFNRNALVPEDFIQFLKYWE